MTSAPYKKMSSSASRRLSSLFLPKPKPTTTTATATATAVANPSGDTKFENLVNKFKKKSRSTNFRRDRTLYKTTVIRLARTGRFSCIHDILSHQKRYPDIKDEHFAARLMVLYGKAKMLDHALQLFDELPVLNCQRNVISLNALLASCFPSGEFDKVVELFKELPGKLSIEPNVITYTTVIRALCEMGSLDEALSMLDEMRGNNMEPNVITFSTLLGTFYYRGRFAEAEKLWGLMEESKVVPDLRCYNSRMLGLVEEKRLLEAVDVFKGLGEKGLEPNVYTYNLLIKGFVGEGDLVEVKKMCHMMIERGTKPNFLTFVAVIPFACNKEDIDFAYEFCKKSVGIKSKVASEFMQRVINKLVERCDVDKAKELLELANSNTEKLSLPKGCE